MAERTLRHVPDTELMMSVRDGDDGAFREIHRRYQRRLLDFFYGMSRSAHTAQDLTQETLFRVWRLRRKYAATGSFPAYLFTFARNIWLEHCREIKKQRRFGRFEVLGAVESELRSHPLKDPDAAAWRSELGDQIARAFDELPAEQRMAFVLRNIDGLSIQDVATILQCPANTVRSRKLLAIKKLRETLREVFLALEAS